GLHHAVGWSQGRADRGSLAAVAVARRTHALEDAATVREVEVARADLGEARGRWLQTAQVPDDRADLLRSQPAVRGPPGRHAVRGAALAQRATQEGVGRDRQEVGVADRGG